MSVGVSPRCWRSIIMCGGGCDPGQEKINNRISPIQDEYIEEYLAEKGLNLTATLDGTEAYRNADFVMNAAPTNYDSQANFFDTHHIKDVIEPVLSVSLYAVMVIKPTIPVGY